MTLRDPGNARREEAARQMFAGHHPGQDWADQPEATHIAYRAAVTARHFPVLCGECGRDGDAHVATGRDAAHRFTAARGGDQ